MRDEKIAYKRHIVFPIAILFLTGMMAGISTAKFIPLYIQNATIIDNGSKTIFLIGFVLYFFETILAVSGSYILLKTGKVNFWLLMATIIFSIEISLNNLRLTFLPIDLHFLIKFNIGSAVLGFGPNFIGILFIFWWLMLYRKDNNGMKTDREFSVALSKSSI